MSAEKDLGPDNPDLPEGWHEAPLATVADVRFSSVDKLAYPSEAPVRLCNYMDVYKNDYITDDLPFMRASATQPEIDRFGLQVGDVIVTKDSETPYDIGRPAVVDYAAPDLVCGYHLALIRPDKRQIDPTFLAKQLGHDRIARFFAGQANGLTRYGLPIGAVMATPLWFPPHAEQETAGALLRLVDQAISHAAAVIAKLKQIRTGLLHDLLTRGLDENGELRNPVAHPASFRDSPFGQIPKNWVFEPLGERLQRIGGFIQTGPFGSQLHAQEYTTEGIPVIMPQDVLEGSVNLSQIARIPESRADDLRRHRVTPGDIVFARRGDLSRCAAITVREAGWLCGTGCLLMRFCESALSPHWLSLAYRHDIGQRQIAARAVGTTMVNLNTKLLFHLRFAFPPIDEQEVIVQVIAEADAGITHESANLLKLALMKYGLMCDLLTGRVQVPADLMKDRT
jgi:type I restriction enzyme, S subunit